jgi:hypothetical protein
MSEVIHDLLNFYNPVRPLSGKTTAAIIIWVAAWFVLSRLWRTTTVGSDRSDRVCIAWSGSVADFSSSLGIFHRVADQGTRFQASRLPDFTAKAVRVASRRNTSGQTINYLWALSIGLPNWVHKF